LRIVCNLKVSEIDSSNCHKNRYLRLLHFLSFLPAGACFDHVVCNLNQNSINLNYKNCK
jgi:hypothetical protein